MSWNIYYARFIPLEVMFHLSPFSFTRGRAKAKCGGVVDDSQIPILGRQILHKYINYEHQPSGSGLLLTITTSVGRNLCADKLRRKHTLRARKHPPNPRQKASIN